MNIRGHYAAARLAVRLLSALVLGAFLAACHEPPVTPAPPAATPSVPPSTPPVTSMPPAGIRTLSGLVFESTGYGRRGIAGGFVDYLVDTGTASGRVSLDTNGRYAIPNLPDRSRIRVTAVAAIGNGILKQTCGAYAFVDDVDTVLDVELVRLGTPGLTYAAPTLSGVVFQATAEGQRPVADTPVVYYSVYKATFDVYTTTDAAGRYEFCGLPLGAGELLAGDCNDSMLPGPVEIRGDTTVLDVDLTSFNRNCPR